MRSHPRVRAPAHGAIRDALLLRLCLADDQPEAEDGWDGGERFRPCPLPPPPCPPQGPGQSYSPAWFGCRAARGWPPGPRCGRRTSQRHSLPQEKEGECVRATGSFRGGGGQGPQERGPGALDGQCQTGSRKAGQSEQRDKQSCVQTDSWTIKDQATRRAHSQPQRSTSASWPSIHSESQAATQLFVTRTVRRMSRRGAQSGRQALPAGTREGHGLREHPPTPGTMRSRAEIGYAEGW